MKLKDELLLINILTILLILVIAFFPIGVLRVILGLPVALLFPGYTLLAALFPRKENLNTIERVALSFGLSIAVVALIGLVLNYTPLGIRLYPLLFSTTLLIIASSVVAWFRRRRLSSEERFSVFSGFNLTDWTAASGVQKGLSIALIVAILASLGVLGYTMSTTRVGEKFTQFYILGPEGKPEGYPEQLAVGEEAEVIVGIVNHEQEDMSYRIRVTVDGVTGKETGSLPLAHEERWQGELSFTPTRAGEDQKVEFLLYKQGDDEPYRKVHLWIDVTPSG